MEYGYEIIDTTGNKTFFVEGCTYCSMSTGGLHEQHCPLYSKGTNYNPYLLELTNKGLEDIKAGRYKRIPRYSY